MSADSGSDSASPAASGDSASAAGGGADPVAGLSSPDAGADTDTNGTVDGATTAPDPLDGLATPGEAAGSDGRPGWLSAADRVLLGPETVVLDGDPDMEDAAALHALDQVLGDLSPAAETDLDALRLMSDLGRPEVLDFLDGPDGPVQDAGDER